MNLKNIEKTHRVIRKVFDDHRTLKCPPCELELKLDEEQLTEGEIFMTDDGEIIYLDIHFQDFKEEDLVEYIEIAEKIYEIVERRVCIYILCSQSTNVFVRESDIKSDADFSIKLAKDPRDFAQVILDIIKNKIKNHEKLDDTDLEIVKELPLRCHEKDRHYYRLESIKIVNRYGH